MSRSTFEEAVDELFEPEKFTAKSKAQHYKRITIAQAALIVSTMLLDDGMKFLTLHAPHEAYATLFLVISTLYFWLVWTLIRGLVQSRTLVGLYFFVLIGIAVAAFAVENPFYPIVRNPVPVLIGIHVALSLLEISAIYVMFRDTFGPGVKTMNNLWGAVSVLFMTTLLFASIFDIVILGDPSSISTPVMPGYSSFSEALYCSLSAIIGGSPSYDSMSDTLRDLIVVEGFGGNLYLVILMGQMINMAAAAPAGKHHR